MPVFNHDERDDYDDNEAFFISELIVFYAGPFLSFVWAAEYSTLLACPGGDLGFGFYLFVRLDVTSCAYNTPALRGRYTERGRPNSHSIPQREVLLREAWHLRGECSW